MKHSEFEIGKKFWCGGRPWRCTDFGTRVIIAILLEHDDDPSWYNGPPYAVGENYFDEYDIEGCSPEPDPYLVGEVQKFLRQRTESPTLCYPDDLMHFLDFFAELDLTDGHFAAAKRARLSVRKRFTERDSLDGLIREGFVVEAAFTRKTPDAATES
jgi:hypothetical protein